MLGSLSGKNSIRTVEPIRWHEIKIQSQTRNVFVVGVHEQQQHITQSALKTIPFKHISSYHAYFKIPMSKSQ